MEFLENVERPVKEFISHVTTMKKCFQKHKRSGTESMESRALAFITAILLSIVVTIRAQCPWQREIPELQTSCICAYNLGRELSVQCDQVDFSTLIEALNKYAKNKSIDLLYVNNSTVGSLPDDIFVNLSLHNVQLSSCKINKISNATFRGQERVLKNLNLQDNLLSEVPIGGIRTLSILNLLDLSKNRIAFVPDGAFQGLTKLSTLKLNDNNVTLSVKAFRGLENSLKNLNLKGTRQRRVPECVRGLKSLAFLDLSLNGIKELPGTGGIRTFEGLDSLTALNLERNLIQNLGETSFVGARKTLSSLSLLNNLLAEFPVGAIHALKELRVLDIGFNLLTNLPEAAFRGNPSITLLALDGNPLSTVPSRAFMHLNATLRGLSLGGRSLHCDCKLRWVAEWIRNGDLQVTSRERNPQFCGSPKHFRDRGFYSLQPDELICPTTEDKVNTSFGIVETLIPRQKPTIAPNKRINNTEIDLAVISTTKKTFTHTAPTTSVSTTASTTRKITTTQPPSTSATSTTLASKTTPILSTTQVPVSITSNLPEPSVQPTVQTNTGTGSASPTTFNGNSNNPNTNLKQPPSWRQNSNAGVQHKQQRPPLVLGFPSQRGTRVDDSNEVQVKNAFRQDNSVIIQWDSDTANILGFRVVYRLFGEKSFKQGPPLEASEREFKIKNVPAQECIIVCVISLEELHVTPETVPYQQCRELRHPLKRSRKLQATQQKSPLPIGGLPVNCCGPASSPGPLGSIATLSAFNNHKEWDQVSAYSGRSIPRPRVYPMDNQDDMRSYFSGMPGKVPKPRSIADGQSQHSFSNNSHRGYLGSAFPTNLVNSRPELRQSRQSLAAASERMSRASYAGSIHGPTSVASSSRRSRPRSRSRDQLNTAHLHSHRPGSRYSTAGSTHTLNNYCDTSDNWTDHDMDIYMARNPTTRNGLVPL
uniref:LRRCT domain-containing protein n=1 Tax=Glossina brevipalpis TaxID=37001 RepID=A0A1A9WMC9_9MUSC